MLVVGGRWWVVGVGVGGESGVGGGERGRERLVCSRARFPGSACEGGEGHCQPR